MRTLIRRTTLLALAMLLTPTLVACGSAYSTEEGETEKAADTRGLELTTKTESSVGGRYTLDGTTIDFLFDKQGKDKHLRVSTTAGMKLIESTIREDGHTTRLLDGRLVVEAKAGEEEPIYTGDRGAELALHEMPESKAMEALEPALLAAKIDPSILPTERPQSKGGIKPQAVGFGNCQTWVRQYGNATCGTWFLGWTDLRVTNCSWNDVWFSFDGAGGRVISGTYNPWGGCNGGIRSDNVNGCTSCNFGGWWWGRNINFQNIVAQDNWSGRYVQGVSLWYGHTAM